MNTIRNPTEKQIAEFCRDMQCHLLAAMQRGSEVIIGQVQKTKEIKTPEYGEAPVDLIYVGGKFMAEFKERSF